MQNMVFVPMESFTKTEMLEELSQSSNICRKRKQPIFQVKHPSSKQGLIIDLSNIPACPYVQEGTADVHNQADVLLTIFVCIYDVAAHETYLQLIIF